MCIKQIHIVNLHTVLLYSHIIYKHGVCVFIILAEILKFCMICFFHLVLHYRDCRRGFLTFNFWLIISSNYCSAITAFSQILATFKKNLDDLERVLRTISFSGE